VPNLHHYITFCANQVFGKALLDENKNDEAVDDFLQRCQDSPFSRKLDLWTLLGMLKKLLKLFVSRVVFTVYLLSIKGCLPDNSTILN
jgi:hypothetical protein